ncbi:Oleosin 5 [Forsythia ovata]|uniref:Oleosin 5 n=1 Tax=Forsythia ovata TaxID=205694 RepID=A0ABD1WSH3_9LAMI
MAERDRPQPHQVQVHSQQRYEGGVGMKNILPQKGPSTSQVLAVITLLPVGGSLLALAGLTLVGSLIGLAVTTPLFIIFSPVLVPAAILVGLAVTAFLTSGAFGLTGLSSLSWVVNSLRQVTGSMPDQLEHAKRRMGDAAVHVGQKTKETGQMIQQKAQEGKESGRT